MHRMVTETENQCRPIGVVKSGQIVGLASLIEQYRLPLTSISAFTKVPISTASTFQKALRSKFQ